MLKLPYSSSSPSSCVCLFFVSCVLLRRLNLPIHVRRRGPSTFTQTLIAISTCFKNPDNVLQSSLCHRSLYESQKARRQQAEGRFSRLGIILPVTRYHFCGTLRSKKQWVSQHNAPSAYSETEKALLSQSLCWRRLYDVCNEFVWPTVSIHIHRAFLPNSLPPW